MNVTGRKAEIELLESKWQSQTSEFVAIYGRRRVGKTYLVRSLFKERFTLHLTGLSNGNLKEQLQNFHTALQEQYPRFRAEQPTGWIEAFQQIKNIIIKSKQKKKVIFIDELPWFDTPNSGFIRALENFWNSWVITREDILLVVCGSAASWMLNKLINNKGGLHNRITQKIKMEPFSLKECEAFLSARKITLDRYQIIQLYMTLGGIPFYWNGVEKGLSAAQNIQKICFQKNGLLIGEFSNLFKSLFNRAERHESIVSVLAKKSKGLTREEILKATGFSNAGSFTRLMHELEESGFIRKYVPFGKKSRNSLYQLSDFFSLFHLKFMQTGETNDENYWIKATGSPKYKAWSGYAFEQVCLAHITEIKHALGISGIETQASSWKSGMSGNGAQIDLVIDRKDGIINLCEMKFSISPFIIDKKYDAILRNKVGVFKTETATRKSIFITLITTFGLQTNAYSGNVQNDFMMDILFQ
jgi:AAA+ ATPase superfamily predicted ATPase